MRHVFEPFHMLFLAFVTSALLPTACLSESDASAPAASARTRWNRSYTSGDPEVYHGISFPDSTNGWVVGDSGKILHSVDAGQTWEPQATSSVNRLTCVQFLNNRKGWAAGGSNTVLKTDDGGRSWSTEHPPGGPPQRTFMALQFIDEVEGWVAHNYGGLLHTRDGGRTWSAHDGLARDALVSVCFLGAKRGWVLSVGGKLLQTADEGQSWSAMQLSTLPRAMASFSTMYFSDTTHGWIGTDTGISSRSGEVPPLFRTIDSGRTWSVQGHWPGTAVRALSFQNDRVGWCAETSGIYSTRDGGASWTKELDSGGDPFVQMVFVGASRGWVLTFTGNVYTYSEQDR